MSSLGLHESRQRRRRRARWTLAKWMIALTAIVAAGIFAYQTGSSLAEREVVALEEESDALGAKAGALEAENTKLRADLILAERRIGEAEARYAADVPTGRMATLLGRVRDKLESGVDLARLEFLIDTAANPPVCEDAATTKRFLVQTPLYQGANDSVGFAGNTITVTASGEAARNAAGQVEAWFDPAQPLTLRMTEIGGRTTAKTGKLPLHASLVIGNDEHRFTVIAGPQGFVQVTGERCRLP